MNMDGKNGLACTKSQRNKRRHKYLSTSTPESFQKT